MYELTENWVNIKDFTEDVGTVLHTFMPMGVTDRAAYDKYCLWVRTMRTMSISRH